MADWFRSLPTAALALAVVLLIRFSLAGLILIRGRSMENTLHDHDILLAFRIYGHQRSLRRGDIVICRYPGRREKRFPHFHKLFVKRVIGLPGETVRMEDGQVLINGLPLAEPYLSAEHCRLKRTFKSVELPPDAYFVMGDSRDRSNDSRSVGPLPSRMLRFRCRAVLFPPRHIRILRRI